MSRKRSSTAASSGSSSSALIEPESYPQTLAELADAEIAARAFSYWEARGFQGGSPEDDWYRAIDELTAERQQQELRSPRSQR